MKLIAVESSFQSVMTCCVCLNLKFDIPHVVIGTMCVPGALEFFNVDVEVRDLFPLSERPQLLMSN